MPEADPKAEPLDKPAASRSRYGGALIDGATWWLLVLGLVGALACGDSETGTEPETRTRRGSGAHGFCVH